MLLQVLMAIVARCCLHTMYEFTAFMNMWAVEALGVSGGVAAQVSCTANLLDYIASLHESSHPDCIMPFPQLQMNARARWRYTAHP